MKEFILLAAFILLGIIIALLNKYARPKQQKSSANQFDASAETEYPKTTDSPQDEYERPEGCCGAHEVCENESLLASNTKIIYFADEELDDFKDRDAESYTSEEIEMFEEVFFTLRENELVDWLKSLQLRHVPLPPAIKEQALMIIAERRKEPAID
jgi:hypothetical protein